VNTPTTRLTLPEGPQVGSGSPPRPDLGLCGDLNRTRNVRCVRDPHDTETLHRDAPEEEPGFAWGFIPEPQSWVELANAGRLPYRVEGGTSR